MNTLCKLGMALEKYMNEVIFLLDSKRREEEDEKNIGDINVKQIGETISFEEFKAMHSRDMKNGFCYISPELHKVRE